MSQISAQRAKLTRRLANAVTSNDRLHLLKGNLGQMARDAVAEANTLTVEEVPIYLRRLPKNLNGFRIVQLSDIHHSPFTSLDHINRAIELANNLKPDLFVLTGDYVSHESDFIAPMARAMGRLKSEFGTYACLGNHDHWTDANLITAHLKTQGIQVLINQGLRLQARCEAFWLAGVDDYVAGVIDLRASLKGSYPGEMKMLLAHNPAMVRRAARAGVDLVLSGHTHGGQVKLRENDNRKFYRGRLSSGLHRRQETQIYITRGIGTVVLPVRYQCPPEISLIELRSHV